MKKLIKIILEIISYMTTILFNILTFVNTNNKVDIYLSFILIIVLFFLFRMWYKLDDIKEKTKALKKIRDKEMIRIINHYNAQIENIEIKLAEINKENKFYKEIKPNNDKERLISENHKTIKKEIAEYNKAFANWKLENYTEGDTKPFYVNPHFDIKTTTPQENNIKHQ
jgi:amino acid permease